MEYLEIANPEDLEEIKEITDHTLIAVAAWIGNTRLIDNVRFNIGSKKTDRS
jgi:pantothenate synthetase